MEGISKEILHWMHKEILSNYGDHHCDAGVRMCLEGLIANCQELQEPWMTLEEFLMSGFEGWCWIIEKDDNQPSLARYNNDDMFVGTSGFIVFDEHNITHVMPIHKPEPPK